MTNETFTELDVDERRELLEKVRDVPFGVEATVVYVSRHGSGQPMPRDGTTRAKPSVRDDESDDSIYLKTDELKGNIVVQVMEDHMENQYHAPIVAYVTDYRGPGRRGRLGELVDVEVIGE